jgi:hypothetical protein
MGPASFLRIQGNLKSSGIRYGPGTMGYTYECLHSLLSGLVMSREAFNGEEKTQDTPMALRSVSEFWSLTRSAVLDRL